mgnify:FL=1
MNKQVIVITGASRGIGRAIAIAFAKPNVILALCCKTNTHRMEETAKLCRQKGAECFLSKVDVSNPSEVSTFFNEIKKRFHGISLLVNNAGISHIGLLQDMTDTEWNNIIQTNLSSVFYCCRETIPAMLHQHEGRIINISSVWGNGGASCEVAYSAAKGGVNAFTKALAKELAPSHIAVNAVALGFIDTEMNRHLNEKDKTELLSEIPAGRAGTPEEAADLVCSIASSPVYLTGQIITMDGGWC